MGDNAGFPDREVPAPAILVGQSPMPPGLGSEPKPITDAPGDPRVRTLREAVEELPDPLRRVVLARHRDHRDFDDIAELLAMTQADVRTLWLRAVERLNRRLDQIP